MFKNYELQSDRLQAVRNEFQTNEFARKTAEKKKKRQILLASSMLLLGAITVCGYLEYLGGVLSIPR